MLTSLIDEGLICLDIVANDKQGLFVELAARLKASGKIANQDQFVHDLWARENLDNTGFEQGVALAADADDDGGLRQGDAGRHPRRHDRL